MFIHQTEMLEALYVDMLSVAQHKHIITVIGEFRERAHKATGVWMMILYMILISFMCLGAILQTLVVTL